MYFSGLGLVFGLVNGVVLDVVQGEVYEDQKSLRNSKQ